MKMRRYAKLPKETLDYIKKNYNKKSIAELAIETGIGYNRVYYALKKIGVDDEIEEEEDDQPTAPIQRPPAIYSNKQYSQLCKE